MMKIGRLHTQGLNFYIQPDYWERGGGGGAVAPLVPIPLSCVQPLLLENAHYVTCAEPQRPFSLPKPPPPGIS